MDNDIQNLIEEYTKKRNHYKEVLDSLDHEDDWSYYDRTELAYNIYKEIINDLQFIIEYHNQV